MQPSDFFDDLDFDPGKLLDHRYQIVATLGHGGMGQVYKAFHVLLDAPVALKELRTPPEAPPEERDQAIRRFCREARLLTRLRHPNIPRVLDYFAEGTSVYLVMDYIEGTTLAERLGVGHDPQERAPLPLAEALDYACQLCDVLIYLHSQQPAVVFGDLKPSNVLLTPDGRAVMIDFGIARASATRSDTPPWGRGLGGSGFADASSDTQPLGTAGYAAPEQYERGWRADPRSDIFALGVLLHEMVTGQAPPPFPFGYQPVRALNPALPGALENLIERALNFHPEERFQSAGEMYQELRLVAQGLAFHRFQTEEIVVPLRHEVPQAIFPAPGRRPPAHLIHLKRTLLASAGAAAVLATITLALLFFGLGGHQELAQSTLGHPMAAAPADTPTPTPTATKGKPIPISAPPTSGTTPPPAPTPTQPSPSPTLTMTPTPSPTPTETPTPLPSPTATPTPLPSPTPSPSPVPSSTPTPTPPPAPSPTPTPPPAPSPTPSPGPSPTDVPSPTATSPPTPTPSPPRRPTPTHVPTPTPTPTPPRRPTPTHAPTPTPTPTLPRRSTPTLTPTPRPSPHPTSTATLSPTTTPTRVRTPTPTSHPSPPPSPTPTSLPTLSPTPAREPAPDPTP